MPKRSRLQFPVAYLPNPGRIVRRNSNYQLSIRAKLPRIDLVRMLKRLNREQGKASMS